MHQGNKHSTSLTAIRLIQLSVSPQGPPLKTKKQKYTKTSGKSTLPTQSYEKENKSEKKKQITLHFSHELQEHKSCDISHLNFLD